MRIHKSIGNVWVIACLLWSTAELSAQDDAPTRSPAEDTATTAETIDLLSSIEVEGARGAWKQSDEGLTGTPDDRLAIIELPQKLGDNYRLDIEFTRTSGKNAVGIVLPLGERQCLLELSGWDGAAHGISRLDGRSVRDALNSTSVRPGTLINDQRYSVQVEVARRKQDISLRATLNREPLVQWRGKATRLEPNFFIRTDNNQKVALAAVDSTVVFHRAMLTPNAAKEVSPAPAEPAAPAEPLPPRDVDLTSVKLQAFKGATRTASFRGEQVLQLNGQEAVALLAGAEMGDGVIECEIASATFCGLAFRAADGKNFEVLYFRPFNSGTVKHKNTVQYASAGVDGGDWASLRREFPGKYEAGADIEVNQWFRAKLVIEGESVTAFVNDEEKPILVVDKMLGGRAKGKIGVWGWGAYYRNFKFTPAGEQADVAR